MKRAIPAIAMLLAFTAVAFAQTIPIVPEEPVGDSGIKWDAKVSAGATFKSGNVDALGANVRGGAKAGTDRHRSIFSIACLRRVLSRSTRMISVSGNKRRKASSVRSVPAPIGLRLRLRQLGQARATGAW